MLLSLVKQALRTLTDASDTELENLIQAALIDLQFGGAMAEVMENPDPLIKNGVVLYCKMHFGLIDPNDYDRIKKAYDELKAQIGMATGYTNWGA